MVVNCKCEPCPECGFKHYCNLSIDHTGPIRTGDCPATEPEKEKPMAEAVTTDQIQRRDVCVKAGLQDMLDQERDALPFLLLYAQEAGEAYRECETVVRACEHLLRDPAL